MENQKKLTPARKSMIDALRLAMEGNSSLAKQKLKTAKKQLDKQYKK